MFHLRLPTLNGRPHLFAIICHASKLWDVQRLLHETPLQILP